MMIPNNNIWGNTIKNITARSKRRVGMTFGIVYEDDMDQAEAILKRLVSEHPLVLSDPEPVIRVAVLAETSVDFIVRPWAKTSDYREIYRDITRSVKEAFDKDGISIPFPQRDLHIIKSGDTTPGGA